MATVRKVSWTYQGATKSAWQVTYTDPHTKKRPSKNFKSKSAADAYKRRVEREIEDGFHIAEARTATIAQVVERYGEFNDQRLAEGRIGRTHIKKIREIMRLYVVPGIGGLRFNNLTFSQIEAWHRSLLNKGLSPATAKRYLYQLKELEDFARKRGFTSGQVIADVCREARGVKKERIKTFTREDARSLFAALEQRPPNFTERAHEKLRCFVYIAAFCGLRFGEIAGLTIEHVDTAERMFRVRHSLTQFDELKGPKTRAGIRDVPMPTDVARMVEAYVRRFYKPNERGLIFTTRSARAFGAANFHNAYWRPLLERAGLDDGSKRRFHFHALRHLAASLMIDHGLSMPRVADLLGHSTFDVTLQVYAHQIIRAGEQHSVVDGIAATLMPPTR